MKAARITIVAAAISAGFSMGAAHAAATASTHAKLEPSILVLAAAPVEARKEVVFDYKGVMHGFIRINAEANASRVATAAPDADECPAEKEEAKAQETSEPKKADKKAPQGPEPIYFAF